MTPFQEFCKELGWDYEGTFKVKNTHGLFSEDTEVTFVSGSNLESATFSTEDHSMYCIYFDNLRDGEPLPPELPEKFKLRNGHLPEVRQWLEDQGVIWVAGHKPTEGGVGGKLTRDRFAAKYLIVQNGTLTCKDERDLTEWEALEYPEVVPTIEPARVTGYTIKEEPNKELERAKRKLQKWQKKVEELSQ